MGNALLMGQGYIPKLTGDALAKDVVSGKTFYNTDSKNKLVGTGTNAKRVASGSGLSQNLFSFYHNSSGDGLGYELDFNVSLDFIPSLFIIKDTTHSYVVHLSTYLSVIDLSNLVTNISSNYLNNYTSGLSYLNSSGFRITGSWNGNIGCVMSGGDTPTVVTDISITWIVYE